MKSKWNELGIVLLLTSLSGGLAACEHTGKAPDTSRSKPSAQRMPP